MSGRRRASWLGGLALEVRHLVGLGVGPLLAACQLVLGLALALLLATLAPQRRVVGQVSGRLLGATRDLVHDAHSRASFRSPEALPTRHGGKTTAPALRACGLMRRGRRALCAPCRD